MFHCHQVIGAKLLLRFPNIDLRGLQAVQACVEKAIFQVPKNCFFRKARFHSTKGLLTQRNAKTKKNTIFGNLKNVFLWQNRFIWPLAFRRQTKGICNFCPRFHRGKARKHILSKLIFARGKMNSSQQGTAAAAANSSSSSISSRRSRRRSRRSVQHQKQPAHCLHLPFRPAGVHLWKLCISGPSLQQGAQSSSR